jgi:RNA 3'-terminal phosphate cyclase-like protein
VRLGQLTPRSIQCLRTIRAFFGVTFNIQPEPESGTVFLSCVGAGMRNVAKRAT